MGQRFMDDPISSKPRIIAAVFLSLSCFNTDLTSLQAAGTMEPVQLSNCKRSDASPKNLEKPNKAEDGTNLRRSDGFGVHPHFAVRLAAVRHRFHQNVNA